jgi:GDP-L-fucose synthase
VGEVSPDALIYVPGHTGLVGSAIVRRLKDQGFNNLLTRTHAELDLTDQAAVRAFFASCRPDYVILAAAKVGGIVANNTYPAEFIDQNLEIQANVIRESRANGIKRLLFLGSSCIYPRDCPQPIKEEYLLTGPLEPTNRPYAVAKIAGIEMCWAYNRQYSTRYLAAMPTNLYGPGDNYDLQTSHVLPALIRKVHEAKSAGAPEVVIWGTGRPRREFLYSDDAADACIFLMSLPDEAFDAVTNRAMREPPLINIGCGEDLTILELAEIIRGVIGYTGRFRCDTSKPDGTPRKLLSVERLRQFGWRPRIDLQHGIRLAYHDYLARVADVKETRAPSAASTAKENG